MPFKSKAQRRKFAQLLVEGDISPETFEEWNRETGGKQLPERVTPKTKKKKAAAKRKTKRAVKRKTKRVVKRKTKRVVKRKARRSRA
jgi:hypothetical protein